MVTGMNIKYIRQDGSALLVALIFLGVLTMLGVSVALTTTTQLKISANSEETHRTFHSTNAGANLLLKETVMNKSLVGTERENDVLLLEKSQSGTEQSVSSSFLSDVYAQTYSGQEYDRQLTVSIKQNAKGVSCPRTENASSTQKISCDYFEVSSTYQHEVNPEYQPSVKIGVYREMIYSNSATAKAIKIPE
ncbi:MAG: hypothetical protein D6B27_09475 [Gammaproteobacteria bacterium]|nr:MAG: hypothetical protein D6B27_09475 [Gammaproteobacteria bacterium]